MPDFSTILLAIIEEKPWSDQLTYGRGSFIGTLKIKSAYVSLIKNLHGDSGEENQNKIIETKFKPNSRKPKSQRKSIF